MEKSRYIKVANYGNVSVVQNSIYQWGVIDREGNTIVPFGKYEWIDGFDSGLARVRSKGNTGRAGHTVAIINLSESAPFAIQGKDAIQQFYDKDRQIHPDKYAKWGIINESGEEVLPLEYDDIWGFLGKNRFSTKVVKNGVESDVYFHDLNPSLPFRGTRRYHYYQDNEQNYNPAYDKSDTWYAMTDGMYGDEPDGFDGDYSFMGY